ncbi:MAG: amidohydrolase family protein [Actinobacteria bacterium]|nr:amidohydrolase family protein [Actinomycetota bacterium]MBU1943925.1 amidohydrolase family protein [Actinomycetota bacterium]MBU2686450.1 amidohydrolase family protein [Actinomycetota bacterium]
MFDLILEHASVIDGSGSEPYTADVGIKGEAIEKIGDLAGVEAARRIDVTGRAVCPGFIDIHSHADLAYFRRDHREVLSPLVRQGITTFVGGNCGMSLAPITAEHNDGLRMYLEVFTQMDFEKDVRWSTMGQFMDHIESDGVLLNTALLAPHGMMRISACGLETGLASPGQVEMMSRSLAESMEAGALGLSTGLQYFPGNQSDTAELVALGRTLAKYDGIFTSHLRSYTQSTLDRAIDEVAEVSTKNSIRSQVSHIFSLPWLGPLQNQALKVIKWLAGHPEFAHKTIPNFLMYGEMNRILRHLDKKRAAGARISMDVMPTTAGFTHLLAFFPSWCLAGDRDSVLGRITDPATRREILHDIESGKPTWPHRGRNDWSLNVMRQMGWDAVTVMAVHSEKNRPLEGRRFTEIADEQGKHPFDVMCDLLIEEDGEVLVFESMAEPDDYFTEKYTFPALTDARTMVTTDTILMGIGKPSYLFYGCYPKFIGRYVNEKRLLDMPSAIARCTSLPAEWFEIPKRGRVLEGFFADLLVLRPEEFRTEAVFRDPERHPEGLDMVIINGKVVVEGDTVDLDSRPGKVLRRSNGTSPSR